MKRTLVLALGLMVVPAVVSAQLEIGLDSGLSYSDVDGATDATIGFSVPTSGARVAFAAGEQLLIETRLGFDWQKEGDASGNLLSLLPGVNFLVNEQVYVRGEAGLSRFSFDDGVNPSVSGTQYIFGAAVGMRRALGTGALLRLEAGVDKALENTGDGIPSILDMHATIGVSAVIN